MKALWDNSHFMTSESGKQWDSLDSVLLVQSAILRPKFFHFRSIMHWGMPSPMDTLDIQNLISCVETYALHVPVSEVMEIYSHDRCYISCVVK